MPLARTIRLAVLALALALAGCGGAAGSRCGGRAECAELIKAGALRAYAATSDGYLLVADMTGSASILQTTSGTLTPLASKFTHGWASGTLLTAYHGGDHASATLPLTVWSAADGAHDLDTAAVHDSNPVISGTHLAWVGNVDLVTVGTADVRLADSRGRTHTLLGGVSMQPSCGPPSLQPAGARLLVSACAPGDSSPTLYSFDMISGKLMGRLALAQLGFSVDAKNRHVLVQTASGTAVADLELAQVTPIASDAVGGQLTPDGNSVVYVDGSGRLLQLPIAGGTATVVQAGPVAGLQAISPDSRQAVYFTQSDAATGFTDLYLTPLVAGATALPLRQQPDAFMDGDAFTADSSFVLYGAQLDAVADGPFWAQPVAGGAPRPLAKFGFSWIALDGARLLVSDDVHESRDSAGYADGSGDLDVIDLAQPGGARTLVAGADASFSLTPDGESVVYSVVDEPARAGVYTMRLP